MDGEEIRSMGPAIGPDFFALFHQDSKAVAHLFGVGRCDLNQIETGFHVQFSADSPHVLDPLGLNAFS